MAQQGRAKDPLAELQTMLTMTLLELGKALRPTDKTGGRSVATSYPKIRSTLPMATEIFQSALDDIEVKIIRAKSTFQRDLIAATIKHAPTELPGSHEAIVPHSPGDLATIDSTSAENANMQVASASQNGQPQPMEEPSLGQLEGPDVGAIGLVIEPVQSSQSIAGESMVQLPPNSPSTQDISGREGNDAILDTGLTASQDLLQQSVSDQQQALQDESLSNIDTQNGLHDPLAQSDLTTSITITPGPPMTSDTDIGSGAEIISADDNLFDDMFFDGDDGTGATTEIEQGQFDNAFFGID